ncbi:MAG: protoporphyrinogen/coproporphyrinogen oxidase [Acidimicrobiales bacterium]
MIIGAGPCGLACARELDALGHHDWAVAESAAGPGGLAKSVVDPNGFTWDLGGHVVFSHFGEFDRLLEEVMGDDVYRLDRSSYVHFRDGWVPYPFQNNLRYLPPDVALECILGLIEAPGGDPSQDFASWMHATFGPGITRHFMRHYNFKVWATPAERMSATWIAERVSVVDYKRALRSLILGEDDLGWGPNNTFMFPVSGGTGEIYRRLASRLGSRIRYSRPVVRVDASRKTVTYEDGGEDVYDALVSTMPLDSLVKALVDVPAALGEAAGNLEHNGVYVVGVGYEAPLEDDRSWIYFPELNTPFYRVTNFAKYSPANVPDGDTTRYTSYLTETAYSPYKPEPRDGITERIEAALREVGLVAGQPPVATMHLIDVDYAYPIPTLGRDDALRIIQPWLMERGIHSRGRFGSWRYEIGNSDHAAKMGIDVARRLVLGEPEELWSL